LINPDPRSAGHKKSKVQNRLLRITRLTKQTDVETSDKILTLLIQFSKYRTSEIVQIGVVRSQWDRLSLAKYTILDQWCGLRPSVLGQDRSETKKNRSWSWSCTLWSRSLQVWCCVVKHGLARLSSWPWRTQQLFKYYLLFLYSVHGT